MLKLNSDYSDYTDETDAAYPLGKAINASTSESYDGTPLLESFMNDLNAAHIATYKKAYGNTTGISGEADTQVSSQFADAVEKLVNDKVTGHSDTRGTNAHGATVEATAGQLMARDEYGNSKVASPIDDGDAANKGYVDGEINSVAGSISTVESKINSLDKRVCAGVIAQRPRWLRFDFGANNKRSLKIMSGTSITIDETVVSFLTDTSFDLSEFVTIGGQDYFVYLNSNKNIIVQPSKNDVAGYRYIGRFHTLCVDAGVMTMIAPASTDISIGQKFLIKSYKSDYDYDFYNFYNKNVDAVTSGSYYNVVTVEHPLSGFVAGDILPESVFCLTWGVGALYDDAMVYDKDTDIAVDVYLQSGTGLKTRSAYGAIHTVNRQYFNHMSDLMQVGKRMIKENEFISMSLGSNQKTSIIGDSDKSTVGGHVDNNNRRMLSAIGVEEACGYLFQWLYDISTSVNTSDIVIDGQGDFGLNFWKSYVLIAGGTWGYAGKAGSRCFHWNNDCTSINDFRGSRGACSIIRGVI